MTLLERVAVASEVPSGEARTTRKELPSHVEVSEKGTVIGTCEKTVNEDNLSVTMKCTIDNEQNLRCGHRQSESARARTRFVLMVWEKRLTVLRGRDRGEILRVLGSHRELRAGYFR